MDTEKANQWMCLPSLKKFVRMKKLNKSHKPDILLSMSKYKLIEGLKKHGFYQENVTQRQYFEALAAAHNMAAPNPLPDLKLYSINNQNEYELTVYIKNIQDDMMKRWFYVEPFGENWRFKARDKDIIMIVPQLEVNDPSTNSSIKSFHVEDLKLKAVLFHMKLGDYPDKQIIIQHMPYHPPKTKEEQWIEAGLKSHYLLQQIIKLGGMKNSNLEPILDMVQDIKLPEHSEHDKERAGIPSGLTNITTIDE